MGGSTDESERRGRPALLRVLVAAAWLAACGCSAPRGEGRGQGHGSVYVSVVMVGRHDNLRGDYTGRMQNSLDFFLTQGQELGVRMEVILVEWNPLPGAARFADILRSPPGCSIPVRVVAVPPGFHSEQAAGTGEPFLEFMAKNVGARRSRGRFVLLTNGDVVLSDSVMRILAAETLDEDAFYRLERTEMPGLLDPLAPLSSRREVVDELLSVLNPEHTCSVGQKECAGSYNAGACEALGASGGAGWRLFGQEHRGLEDEPFLPAAGDFFLIARNRLHALGGYHQVPSTTHLDSLLVCKARGARLRQVVFLRPCFLVHQRHPAPMQPLRYILPGWELTDESCAGKASDAARALHSQFPYEPACDSGACSAFSMDPNWGFPNVAFEERSVAAANISADWQALTLLPITVLDPPPAPPFLWQGGGLVGAGRYEWERRALLWVLASLRFHEWRPVMSPWCAFEVYSRWHADRLHINELFWTTRLLSTTCRHPPDVLAVVPVPPVPAQPSPNAPHDVAGGVKDLYVSVVIAARADEFRGDSVSRLQNVIDVTCRGFEEHQVRGEIVVVDWMPSISMGRWMGQGQAVPLSLRLENLLRVRSTRIPVSVITVDASQEREEWKHSGITFREYEAKNIGARRARGRFLVLSNSDVILSESIFRLLASESLEAGSFFRTESVNFPGILDVQAPLSNRAEALSLLKTTILGCGGPLIAGERDCKSACAGREPQQPSPQAGPDQSPVLAERAGDFTLISAEAFDSLGGYSQVATTMHLDSFLLCRAQGLGLKQDQGEELARVYLIPSLLSFSHPAPVMSNRLVAPGWEWSESRCEAQRASVRIAKLQGSEGHSNWGWPKEVYRHRRVQVASTEDWQWYSLEMALKEDEETFARESAGLKGPGSCQGGGTCESNSLGLGEESHSGSVLEEQEVQHASKNRVVFCVASTIERVWHMHEALASIQEQAYTPDELYVSLPEHAERPQFLSGLKVISHHEDLGPIHKLLDCVREEPDPATIIVTFDDDMRVDPGLAERLVHAITGSFDAAVGFAGWNVTGLLSREPPKFESGDFAGQHLPHAALPMNVDVLEGYSVVAYRRGFFDIEDLEGIKHAGQEVQYADDVWISGCLAKRGIKRVVLPLREWMPPGAEGIPLEVMFRDIWAQSTPQHQSKSLKMHPDRGMRNKAAAMIFLAEWG